MRFLFLAIAFLFLPSVHSQTWNSIAPVPTPGRDDGVAFSIGNYGYLVTGRASDYAESNRLLQYDPTTDSWSDKMPFPGIKRQYSVVFCLEERAFLVGGYSENGAALSDVWEYNATNDQWIQRNDFPGLPRWDATAVTIQGTGYFGLGTTVDSTLSDLWKYSANTDEWTLITHYPEAGLRSVIVFPLLNQLIFGQGFSINPIAYTPNWYAYDPVKNTWSDFEPFPAGKNAYGTAVSNGFSAVVCGGMDEIGTFHNNCYTIDFRKEWTAIANIGNTGLRGSSGFYLNNGFYIGTGLQADLNKTSEWYRFQYTPPSESSVVFPNPSTENIHLIAIPESEVKVYTTDGKCVFTSVTDAYGYCCLTNLPKGYYLLSVGNETIPVERL